MPISIHGLAIYINYLTDVNKCQKTNYYYQTPLLNTMSRIISLSVDNEFANSLETLIEKSGYKNRSRFLRDAALFFAEIKQKAQQVRNSGLIGGEVILENSLVGESASNGYIENGIKEVQNQIRKLENQIQSKLISEIQDDSHIWPWFVQNAGQLIHTFKVYKVVGRSARQ